MAHLPHWERTFWGYRIHNDCDSQAGAQVSKEAQIEEHFLCLELFL